MTLASSTAINGHAFAWHAPDPLASHMVAFPRLDSSHQSSAPTATHCVAPTNQKLARLSGAGVAFLLEKLAQAVVPVRVCTDPAGPIRFRNARVCRSHDRVRCWYLSGPDIDTDLIAVGPVWLMYRATVHGNISSLLMQEVGSQSGIEIQGQRADCTAWCALIRWLLLREGRRAG